MTTEELKDLRTRVLEAINRELQPTRMTDEEMVFYTGSTDQLLNRFVDIIQMEETNRALTTNNTQYSLKEQLTGTRKKFDVDKAYTAVRAEVNGKFVNVLPVPTLSKESVWTAHRIIYRGY